MEIIDQKENKIDAVKNRTESMEKSKCPQAKSNQQPKIRHVGKLIECLEKQAGCCPFSLSYGHGFYCKRTWDN